jgi:hypothetical protein
MPKYDPVTEIVVLDRPARPYSQAALLPPVLKMPDGRLVVDEWARGSAQCCVKVWRRADHANLEVLPANAPRVVKALYRSDGQFALLRGEVTGAIRALNAWSAYQSALSAPRAA